MSDDGRLDLEALLVRLQAGDEEAANAIVRQFGDAVRNAIERVLRRRKSQAVGSTSDVCQTTFWDFLEAAAAGRYTGLPEEKLRKLLVSIAQNRARDQLRRQRAECRDARRVVATPVESLRLTARSCRRRSSRAEGDARALLDHALARLAPDERELVQARLHRHSWCSLAQERGTTPDALRMKFSKLLNRLREELVRASRGD